MIKGGQLVAFLRVQEIQKTNKYFLIRFFSVTYQKLQPLFNF